MPKSAQGRQTCEVAVVGAGAAGLAAAIALARDGVRTALIGPHRPVGDGRTVALLGGSVRMLEALDIWSDLANDAAPLAELHLIDDTGSLFRPPPARFVASEIGLSAFGWNIQNARLVEGLRTKAYATSGLILLDCEAGPVHRDENGCSIALDDGSTLKTSLIVGADGAGSPLRSASGIAVRSWTYPQAAVTTLLAHDRQHGDVSTEIHTRAGPFTLVPLPGGHRSSLVWVAGEGAARRLVALDDPALADAVKRQAQSLLGPMRIDGPRGLVPMRGLSVASPVATRLALIGEAAHVFPPIGAQGLNLGLRDAAALRDAVLSARHSGRDPGSPQALAAFARGRSLDARLRGTAVDLLNRSLLTAFLPVDALRGLGLITLTTIAPLRRMVMREGVQPRLGAPSLMR